jgi:hypothetical protein
MVQPALDMRREYRRDKRMVESITRLRCQRNSKADAEAEVKHIGLQEDEMQLIVTTYSAKMLTIWKPNRFDLDVIRLSSRSDETSASSLEAPPPPPSLPLTTSAR